ncbi:MAG: amidohydrolase [Candidatus Bathyarchaeota archaeon]|nr:amidohydrolase [Candidatus Bathyarchaeota archaeon]
MSKQVALSWIDENEKRFIEISDEVWEYAELGLLEHKTSKLLADEIERHGFEVERGVADMPTAFVATWGSGSPTLGVLGELDALAGISQKPVPYRDPVVEGAPGHGCGHNIHGTGGMAGAVAIKAAMEADDLPGTVRFYGCPAEETLVGKVWMVRHGLFDGVDAVLSHHPGSANTAGTGSSNAMNSVKFHFYGRTAHSAGDPENGISALDAVELMSNGVNFMREHIIEKARVHYVTEEGGGQPNVVPAYARTWYYVRAPERDQVEYIYKWVLDIADGADKMARTTHEVEFLTGCYNTLPNGALSELVVENMREIGAPVHDDEDVEFAEKLNESIDRDQKINGLRKSERPGWEKLVDELFDERVLDDYRAGKVGAGSTDVSDVSWVTPAIEFTTTCVMLGTPGHSWQNVAQSGSGIGHKGLVFASKVIAASGLDLLTKPELLKRVRDEWEERLAGRVYKPPIPADLKPPLHQLE